MSVVEHKNKILYLDNEGKVRITKVAEAHPWFSILYKSDRQGTHKPFFQKCIEYLFYMYHEDSPYIGMNKIDRSKTIKTTYDLESVDETNDDIINIGLFLEQTMYTSTQQAYLKCIDEVSGLIQHISKLPYQYEEKVNKTFQIADGQKQLEVSHIFRYDNMKLKQEAWDSILKLEKILKELESKVIKEEKKRTSEEKRLFDN